MSDVFILDSCALIAILKSENGADKVAVAYQKAEKLHILDISTKNGDLLEK